MTIKEMFDNVAAIPMNDEKVFMDFNGTKVHIVEQFHYKDVIGITNPYLAETDKALAYWSLYRIGYTVQCRKHEYAGHGRELVKTLNLNDSIWELPAPIVYVLNQIGIF